MAAKKKSKKVAAKKAKAASVSAENSVTVPAKNVGAACQAAVSFEGAVRIEAVKVAGGEQYVVTWS